MSYNDHVDPFENYIPRSFLLPRCLKGAVCQRGYSLEQSNRINQTVPLSL